MSADYAKLKQERARLALKAKQADAYAKAEKTVVDGIVFFDIEQENAKNELVQKERNELINLMLDAKNKGLKTQEPKKKSTGHYHCDTLGEKCRVFHAKYNN